MIFSQIKKMIEGPNVKEYAIEELTSARKKYVEAKMLKDYYDNMTSYYEKKIDMLQNTLKTDITEWEKYDNIVISGNTVITNTKTTGMLNLAKVAA